MSNDVSNSSPIDRREDTLRDHAVDFLTLRVSPEELERVASGSGASAQAVREYLGR